MLCSTGCAAGFLGVRALGELYGEYKRPGYIRVLGAGALGFWGLGLRLGGIGIEDWIGVKVLRCWVGLGLSKDAHASAGPLRDFSKGASE